jgi:ferredoxin-thioredoxin reductase catalytic chain
MDESINKENIENQIKIWQEFTDRQPKDQKFILNPNKEIVERLAQGVLINEKNKLLKFCPCRITTKNKEQDMKLVCPCNFKSQKTWIEKQECWCSLFIKQKQYLSG